MASSPKDKNLTDSELANNCKSKLYVRANELLDLGLKLMDLGLVESDDTDGRNKLKNRLKKTPLGNLAAPTILTRCCKPLATVWNWPTTQYIVLLIALYFTIKYPMLVLLQIRYSDLSGKMRLHLESNNISTRGHCVLGDPDYGQQQEQDMAETRHFLNLLSSVFVDTHGLYVYSTVVLYPIILIPVSWLFAHLYVIRLDWLMFASQPERERRRMGLELDKTRANLLMSSAHGDDKLKRSMRVHLRRLKALKKAPAHLDDEWHRLILKIILHLCQFKWIFTLVVTLATVFTCLLMVFHQNFKVRLGQLECKSWHPQAQLISPSKFSGHTGLNEVTDEQDLAAYNNYDRSWSQFLYLLILVEPKYSISIGWLFTVMEMSLIMFLSFFWVLTTGFLYIVASLSQIVWLIRINRQLDVCITLARHERKRDLLKLIIETHLNYSLFKSQFARFRHVASLQIIHAGLLILSHMWTIYLSKRSVGDPVDRYILVGISFIIFYVSLNYYFVIYAYLFLQIERSMRKIAQLLASIQGLMPIDGSRTTAWLNFWHIMWSKQMLSSPDLTSLFGLSMLGIRLTFAYLIQVNFYPTAILFYLINENIYSK